MALTDPQSGEPDLVAVLAAGDVDRAVAESLAEMGLSFAELEAEAQQGRFSSDRARVVWLAIRNIGLPRLGHPARPASAAPGIEAAM